MKHATLQLQRSDNGEWYWFFIAANGREIARSSETYKRRGPCERGARLTLGLDVPGDVRLTDGLLCQRGAAAWAPIKVRVYP